MLVDLSICDYSNVTETARRQNTTFMVIRSMNLEQYRVSVDNLGSSLNKSCVDKH